MVNKSMLWYRRETDSQRNRDRGGKWFVFVGQRRIRKGEDCEKQAEVGGDVWAWAAAGPISGFMALLQPRSVKSMALDTTEPQRGLDYTELDPPPHWLR